MFEAVGSYAAGTMTEEEVKEYEEKVCPTCGSCSGMYTANSMNCLTEALGMGLGGNGTIPAVYSERIKLAKHAGMAVMDMYNKNIRPRDIMTKSNLKCPDRRYGIGMFYKQYVTSSCDCPRSRF